MHSDFEKDNERFNQEAYAKNFQQMCHEIIETY